ncbi:MAG: sugar ABC transporter permease [Atribacterota bacterium]|jgi:multiple sugar transport system permease protein|uniref:Lactose transport system permease protein LacF n=3 Tax=Atribacter TaxID=2847777 RepID=A0A1V5SYH7_9BACT|nr:sugar ABC transporter permease [Atribacterota bacterium]OQA59414.1 MAG: Lactose transport system permease protein LacF [Candidatus Atribacteria bacterium ADurb.Bin276]
MMKKKQSPDLNYGIVFILPAILFLSITSLIPLAYSLGVSFTNLNLLRPGQPIQFVGLQNYSTGIRDGEFLTAAWNTILIVSVSLGLQLLIGLMLSLILSQERKGFRLWQTILLIPNIIAPVVVGVLWRLMFNPDYGIFKLGLAQIGIDKPWLQHPIWAKVAVIIVETWTWTPFVMLTLIAGLKSLSDTPFEAARIDGASGLQIFRYITMPLLKPVIAVTLLLRLMDAFKMFDSIYVLTYGGPGLATEVLSLRIYKKGLKYFDITEASAQSWIFLICIFVISYIIAKKFVQVEKRIE